VMSRGVVNRVTSVPPVDVPEPEVVAWCTNTASEHPLRIAVDIVGPFPGSDRENISPDHHELLHEVTRILRHPQPRGIDFGRRPSHKFLPLWCPDGDAQHPRPDLRIQADAGGSGVTGVSVKLEHLYASCQVEWWNATFVTHTHTHTQTATLAAWI
jgi:hypothetical protein